jgi:hypothetical protein
MMTIELCGHRTYWQEAVETVRGPPPFQTRYPVVPVGETTAIQVPDVNENVDVGVVRAIDPLFPALEAKIRDDAAESLVDVTVPAEMPAKVEEPDEARATETFVDDVLAVAAFNVGVLSEVVAVSTPPVCAALNVVGALKVDAPLLTTAPATVNVPPTAKEPAMIADRMFCDHCLSSRGCI